MTRTRVAACAALGALALLHHRRRRRLDLHRRTLCAQFCIDLAALLALLAQGAGLLPLARLLAAALEHARHQRPQRQRPLAQFVHHVQPRQACRQGHRNQQQCQQEQVAAHRPEAAVQGLAHHLAEDAAAAGREVRGPVETQVQQPRGRHQKSDNTDQAQRGTQVRMAIAIGVHAKQGDPRDQAQHHRQQEGDITGEIQQHVRKECADLAPQVVQRRGHASRLRPAGILWRVRHQAGQQVHQQRRNDDQRDVAHEPLTTGRWRGLFGRDLLSACCGRLRHRDVLP